MGSFLHIDDEQHWKNRFKYVDGGEFTGPGWYNKDTGQKDEPSSKVIDKAPTTSASIISGRPLKPPGEFNSLLKDIKKKTKGVGINTY